MTAVTASSEFRPWYWVVLALILAGGLWVAAHTAPEDNSYLFSTPSTGVEAAYCVEVVLALQPGGLRPKSYPGQAYAFWFARLRAQSSALAQDIARAKAALAHDLIRAGGGEGLYLREAMVSCSNRALAHGVRFNAFGQPP